MTIRVVHVDAFTSTPFGGNPAAVAFFDDWPDDDVLQAVALEMNLSETAYPRRRSDGDWDLRWFTPVVEVELCGHATLATAHVLFSDGLVPEEHVTFHTRSGPLVCRRTGDRVTMDFPAARARPCPPVPALTDALKVPVLDQGRSFDLVAQLDRPETVADLRPDLTALAAIDTRAVVVTAAGDLDGGPAHFVSRVFAPRVGVNEDPVTGSAHCITGPWWAERLGREELEAHQVSARGGRMTVRIRGDRVELAGHAVTVLDGVLTLDLPAAPSPA